MFSEEWALGPTMLRVNTKSLCREEIEEGNITTWLLRSWVVEENVVSSFGTSYLRLGCGHSLKIYASINWYLSCDLINAGSCHSTISLPIQMKLQHQLCWQINCFGRFLTKTHVCVCSFDGPFNLKQFNCLYWC